MISIKEKERLIREHLEVQRILNSLPVYRECESCEWWTGKACAKFNAVPPEDVQKKGCDQWQEKDTIPF